MKKDMYGDKVVEICILRVEFNSIIFWGIPKLDCVPQFDAMHRVMTLGANYNDRNLLNFFRK